jgi:excisionase family DNA binding protein
MLLEQPSEQGSDPDTASAVPDERFLTRAQAALYLGVPVSTIYQWARTGRLQCVVTLGGHLRFSRADLDAAGAVHPRSARRLRTLPEAHLQYPAGPPDRAATVPSAARPPDPATVPSPAAAPPNPYV